MISISLKHNQKFEEIALQKILALFFKRTDSIAISSIERYTISEL